MEFEQSRLLTLVFTDLVASLRLKTEHGDQKAAELISQHRVYVQDIVKDLKGREIDSAGDGFFLTFETPSSAVLFSLRLQLLHIQQSELPKVRIGIHTGEVTEKLAPSEFSKPVLIEGLAVDLASRVQALAEPDQILMTKSVFQEARQRLLKENFEQEILWKEYGLYLLKGFETSPMEIAEVGFAGFSPLSSPSAKDKGIPAETSHSLRKKQAFLCYRQEDRFIAENLALVLEDLGFQPWINHSLIHESKEWKGSIIKALKESDCIILCLTAQIRSSDQVMYTLDQVREYKPILPLLMGDRENFEHPLITSGIDFVNNSLMEGKAQLKKALLEISSELDEGLFYLECKNPRLLKVLKKGEIYSVGRDANTDIHFPSSLKEISREHLFIHLEAHPPRLIASGKNGTFLNGEKIDVSAPLSLDKKNVVSLANYGVLAEFLITPVKEKMQFFRPTDISSQDATQTNTVFQFRET